MATIGNDESVSHESVSPDLNGAGLVSGHLKPLRYDGLLDDPHETAGMLRSVMPCNARVLDVGCGTGWVTIIANRDKQNRVLAVEPDPDRAKLCQNRGIETICGILTTEILATRGPFDVVVFADVLEHLTSPDAVLQLAVSGLEPGGLVLASIPNVAHWTLRLKLLMGNFDYRETGLCDATHLRWFTQRSTETLFRSHGLEILNIQGTTGLWLPIYASRLLRPIPRPMLDGFVRTMTRRFPRLFGCQFIVVARKP